MPLVWTAPRAHSRGKCPATRGPPNRHHGRTRLYRARQYAVVRVNHAEACTGAYPAKKPRGLPSIRASDSMNTAFFSKQVL
jgi:hypothetical protein